MKQFFKFTFASCLGVLIAGICIILLSFWIISSLLSSSSSVPVIEDNSVLVIKLDKPIYDREVNDVSMILSNATSNMDMGASIGLTEFISVINNAKKDSKIKAIMLDLSSIYSNGWATIEELRQVLADFKSSGKKIYAYSDTYAQNAYYLSTIADKVYLNPVGLLQLSGLGGEVMYLKDLFTKFDIQVDLIRPQNNKYKSAGETYVMNKMSDANREQIRSYIGSIWGYLANNISESRKITLQELNNNVNNLDGFIAEDALRTKLVDALLFKTDLQDTITKDLGNKKINWLTYSKYRNSIVDVFPSGKDQIALIYAYGDVMQGKGNDLSIGSETIVREIRKAVESKRIKAIVLRVNSPGGDAIASEQITNEIFNAKKVKPVIVSMGDMAASAGYEMSCGATKIVAMPITLTGSIGVFAVVPNFGSALKKNLGITFDTVTTHKNSTFLTVTSPMTSDTRAAMQKNTDVFYNNFISRVSKGRGLSITHVDSIARGRVWTAMDAKKIGLVDEFGGLAKAIEIAAKEAKISNYGVVAMPKTKDITSQLFEALGQETEVKMFARSLGKPYSFFLELKNISEMKGVQARLPYVISF